VGNLGHISHQTTGELTGMDAQTDDLLGTGWELAIDKQNKGF